MSIEGVLIVSTYSYPNYVMLPRDVTTRIVKGVEIPEVKPGISFDFELLGSVPLPALQKSNIHGVMRRGRARGQLDVTRAAKRAGLTEQEVLTFFANHADYGHSLLAIDKKTWQVIPREDLLTGQLPDDHVGDRVRVADNPDFEDRGEIDGKQMYYCRPCGKLIRGAGAYGHSQGAKHKAAKAEQDVSTPPPETSGRITIPSEALR